MHGINRATLAGNLGADPELRHTGTGKAVLRLRLATTQTYLDAQGQRQERTDWHTVTVWGKRGAALAKYLAKGSPLLVEGTIRTSSYEKEGVTRWVTEIVAQEVILLGRKPEGAFRPAASPAPGEELPPVEAPEDDIPF
jgi:single-strand DNA-binding protein